MYESGTSTEFEEESNGATPSWIVSVLKVGADDATAKSERLAMKPRMMNRSKEGLPADLR